MPFAIVIQPVFTFSITMFNASAIVGIVPPSIADALILTTHTLYGANTNISLIY